MTKGEAVDYIKEWLKDEYALNSKDRIVLKMAIEALQNLSKPNNGLQGSDTISRSQAIKDVSEWATDILHPDRLVKEDAIYILESLPSAGQVTGKLNNPDDSLLTADSEACNEQNSKLDLISRRDAIAYFFRPYSNEELYSNIDIEKALNALPSATSAEVEDRLYIKIYADDEPSVKAEKLYQICGETQNREVAEWLKEYFPSASDSRQRGEWVGCTGCEHYDQQQTSLICHDCRRYYSDKYKGGEDE